MSLLDDVSIVVTPNGYKAGELFAVLPTYAEGAELINLSSFASATNWAINGSEIEASGTTALFKQPFTLGAGKTFKITIVIESITSGNFEFWVGGYSNDTPTISSADTYTYYVASGGSESYMGFNPHSNLIATISSVSVKEVTSADMDVTRATAATRVDENGLVNYAEVIGGELLSQPVNLESDFTAVNGGSFTNASTLVTTGGSVEGFTKTSFLIVGKTYKLIIAGTTTSSAFSFGNTTSGGNEYGSGFGTFYFTASGNTAFWFRQSTAGTTNITSFSVKEVTRDNVPRIDYTGGGCPHILAEPQRTNLVPYSEDFSNADWGNASIGTTPVLTSGFISPDGTNNAYKISNANQNSMWFSATLIGASDSRTIYARTVSGTGTAQLLSHNSNTNNTFNLTEEWQRFEVSTTTSGTGSTSYYAVDFRGSGTLTELLIWGAQTEVGSYPTSYIPNFGTALGVTRNQDIFTRDGIGSLINSTEGVLFLEMAALSDDLSYRILSLSNGTSNERVYIQYTNVSNKIGVVVKEGGSTQANMSYVLSDETSFAKVAIKWKVNDFALWVNGFERDTDTLGNTPVGLNRLALDNGNSSTGGNKFFGKVKQLQVYDTALTDEQLEALTS